jgi:hypothetical protein
MSHQPTDPQNPTDTPSIPPPPTNPTPYVPTDEGLVWALNVERLSQPSEFTPTPVSNSTAIDAFPETTYNSLATRRQSVAHTAFDDADESSSPHPQSSSSTDPSSSDTTDESSPDSSDSSLVAQLADRIHPSHIRSQLRRLRNLPPRGIALLAAIALPTLTAGLFYSILNGIGLLLILTGSLVLYTAVTFDSDSSPGESSIFDDPRRQQLYDRAVVLSFGILLVGLGLDTLGPRLVTPF